MNTALVPQTITIGRRRFGGLLTALAAGSAVVGGAIAAVAVDVTGDRAETTPAVEFSPTEHVQGVQAASPQELAATYGNVPFGPSLSETYTAGVLAASPEERAATYGNVPFKRWLSEEYVAGVLAASPEQLAATYGRENPRPYLSPRYVAGVLAASPEELMATYGNVTVEP